MTHTINTESYHPFRSEDCKKTYMDFYNKKAEKWPLPCEIKLLETSYGTTHVRINGVSSLKPLILMHGAQNNSLSWIDYIDDLSKNFQIFAVDNIYSSTMSIYNQKLDTLEKYMDWMDEVITLLDLKTRPSMLGLSYGAWLIANYALIHPEKLSKVMLIAPPSFVIPCTFQYGIKALLSLLPFRYFSKNMVYWAFDDLLRSGYPKAKEIADEFAENLYLSFRCYKLNKLVTPKVIPEEKIISYKVPVYFVIGENDKSYDAKQAVLRLKSIAPDIKTELISDSGHDLPLVKVQELKQMILKWFN